jgi:hypothetical protein
MPPVINSIIALSLLMVTPTSVLAQANSPEHEAQLGTAFPECRLAGAKEITECIFGGAPVLDAPFSAEAVTAWHPRANSGRAELRATARYYRDRVGRVPVDQIFVGHELRPLRIIVTPDPNSRAAYLLDQ